MGANLKKLLESGAIIAWIVLLYLVVGALYGANKLPARIPTHFGMDGKPNGWGGPESLWLLPAVGTLLALLMTVVSRHPQSFNYPVRVTRENRARLEGLALEMIAWLRLEVLCLFAWIEWATIEMARQGKAAFPPHSFLFAILPVLATIVAYMARMARAR